MIHKRARLGGSTDRITLAAERNASIRGLLFPASAPAPMWGLVTGAVAIALETLLVLTFKTLAPTESFGFCYLIGVMAVSSIWGLGVSATVSVASALALAYFRDWPAPMFHPLSLNNVVVMAIFLVVALCANVIAGLARASRDRAVHLAQQQAALRRVATLVARGADPQSVFATVAEEMAHCLHVDHADVFQYEPEGIVLVAASYARPGDQHLPVGERTTLDKLNISATILRTGKPARIDDFRGVTGIFTERLLSMGVRCRVGAPIVVDDHVWGAALISWSRPEPLPDDIEDQIAEFADLVATAIAASTTRAQLRDSRARIVAAGDEARRRLERDLHDGAQQHLVALGLQARLTQELLPPGFADIDAQLTEIVSGLGSATAELQELSRGLHPAALSTGGLTPALKMLARRSAVPVDMRLSVDGRYPATVEVAAYYVVAEALTNAAKHACASEVTVEARSDPSRLYLVISDDGVGGAHAGRGSGLIGLQDRVEALGGRFAVNSPPGQGTSLNIDFPCAN